MATFLVTPSMSPALRARVERAVSHRARARHHAAKLGMDRTFASKEPLKLPRILPIALGALIATLAVLAIRHERRALAAERSALLAAIEERRAALPRGFEGSLATIDRAAGETASGAPEVVDPALRERGALDALLRRPAVYVHATAAELADAPKIGDAARASMKDAFLVCLTSPPPSATERELLGKVRGVYFGGAKVDEATANVRRLADARVVLGPLGSAFADAARVTEERAVLHRMRRDLEATPLDAAKKALAAEVLIAVADLPQGARVSIVDLAANKPLLRVERRTAERDLSSSAAMYRAEIDACALALAVRHRVEE
jgi:hypothetical protein